MRKRKFFVGREDEKKGKKGGKRMREWGKRGKVFGGEKIAGSELDVRMSFDRQKRRKDFFFFFFFFDDDAGPVSVIAPTGCEAVGILVTPPGRYIDDRETTPHTSDMGRRRMK